MLQLHKHFKVACNYKMTISEIIQKHLRDFGSSVSLGLTVDGTFTQNIVYVHDASRTISVHAYEGLWGITLSEKEFCYARFLTSETLKLAQLFDLWLGQKSSVSTLKNKFFEVEVFQDFASTKTVFSKGLIKAWNKLKNFFFKEEYSSESLHFDINAKILEDAMNDPVLNKLYPYSSLGRISFSNNKDGIGHYLCIAANRWENRSEKYFANLPPNSRQVHFANLDEGFNLIRENIYWLEQPITE